MNDKDANKPPWLAPVIVLVIVVALAMAKKKGKDDMVENPIVEFAIITVAVFAFAAVFRIVLTKLGSPGGAAFFGAPIQPHPAHSVTTDEDMASGY